MSEINWVQLIESGALQVNSLPGKIKIITLKNYLAHTSKYTKLVKAIKLKVEELEDPRLTLILKNSYPKNYKLNKVCVFFKGSVFNSLEDLIAIDYSVLFNQKEKIKLFNQYPKFKSEFYYVFK